VRQSSPSVSTLISASGILGRGIGEKRLDIILQKVPNFVEKCPSTKELESVPGISTILSEKIIVNHFKMMQLLSRMKLIFPNLSTANEDNNDDDSKFIVCLSGFRIKPPHTYNCVFTETFSKSCKLLVIKDEAFRNTNKTRLALKHNIPIVTKFEFDHMKILS
jgi:hypothetical protein